MSRSDAKQDGTSIYPSVFQTRKRATCLLNTAIVGVAMATVLVFQPRKRGVQVIYR